MLQVLNLINVQAMQASHYHSLVAIYLKPCMFMHVK